MTNLGPGTLKIGPTGTEHVLDCLVNGCRVTAEKDQADSTTKLCGTVVPGATTYTASLTGNLDVDSAKSDGLFALSWAEPGSEQEFEFVPNTEDGTAAAGTLLLDPLDFGADAYGDPLTSDFTFSITGDVTFTYVPPVLDDGEPAGDPVTRVFRTGVPVRRARRAPVPA